MDCFTNSVFSVSFVCSRDRGLFMHALFQQATELTHTREVISAAIKGHENLGPEVPGSIYECLLE